MNAPRCAELEIALRAYDKDRYRVELRFTRPHSDAEIRPKRDGPHLTQFDFARLRRLQLDAEDYGAALTAQLFADPALKSDFLQFYHTAQTLEAPLRIKLFIGSNAQELHALRWETLRNPESGPPLLTDENILFSRFLSSEDWQPVKRQARGAVRALVAVANPSNLDEYPNLTPIDVDAEMARITASLDDLPVKTLASPDKASLDNIVAELREGYDILYVVAHGVVRNGQPRLWLEQADGTADVVTGDDFVARIQQLAQRPRLVVLTSCQSARVEDYGALSALGPRLTQAGIPAVLAMQGDVSAVTMEQFLPTFFEELRRDGQIDRAVTVARGAVQNRPDWWMPTLFLRLKSGRLWSEDVIWGKGENPYRGLRVFEREHADLYFGRETATCELLDALSRRDFVALIGVSGSGKSSLVRAGLEKGLREYAIPGLAERSRCLTAPGRNPLLNLVLSLADTEGILTTDVIEALDLPEEALVEEKRSQTADVLNARTPQTLGDALRACAPREGVLLILDQFERLYTECDDDGVRRHFIDTLLAAAGDKVKVLLALRADYYGLALEHPGLEQVVKQDGQMTLGRMTETDLRAIIEQPAQTMGRTLETGLTERLIADVHERAGDLPLLEFALTELWERDSRTGLLTLETYAALGYEAPEGKKFPGVRGAVAQRAEAVWQKLDEQERQAARRVFLNLVTPGPLDERGKRVAEDASRRAWQVEWNETTRHVVRKLVDARLLTSGQDLASDQPIVEVAHEALIRAWPRLQRWLEDYRPFIRWYNNDLAPFLHRWLDKEQQPDFLLPKAMLVQAQHWLDRYPDELSGPPAAYICASIEEHKREQAAAERRRRRLTLASVGAAAVFLILALLAWGQRNLALDAQATAEQQARISLARQLAAQSQQLKSLNNEKDNSLARLLAIESLRLSPEPEANMVLREGFRLGPPIEWSTSLDWREEIVTAALDPEADKLAIGGCMADALGRCYVGYDGFLKILDAETGEILSQAQFFDGYVSAMAFDPSGNRLAFSVRKNNHTRIVIWDVVSYTKVLSMETASEVIDLEISPNGRWLISKSFVGTWQIWDTERGKEILGLRGEEKSNSPSLEQKNVLWAFSSEDEQIAIVGDDIIDLWRMDAQSRSLEISLSNEISAVAISSNDRWLAAGSRNGIVKIWQIAEGHEVAQVKHSDWVNLLEFNPDSSKLISGSADGEIQVLDLTTQDVTTHFLGAKIDQLVFRETRILGLNAPSCTIVSCGSSCYCLENSLAVWDINAEHEIVKTEVPGFNEFAAVTPDGEQLISVQAHDVKVWNIAEVEFAKQSYREEVGPLYNPEGQSEAVILDFGESIEVHVIEPDNGERWIVSASCDQWNLVADCDYGSVQISNANSEKVVVNVQLEGNTGSVLLHSNVGLALVRNDTEARVFNLQRGFETMKVEYSDLYSVHFHPHGEFIVTAGCYHESPDHCTASVVQVWDLSTGYEVSRMDYSGEVTAYFTPNGERIISTGCSEYDVTQENASRMREVKCEKWDTFTWVWASEDLIDLTCAALTRNLTRKEWQQYLGTGPYQATCPNLPTPQD